MMLLGVVIHSAINYSSSDDMTWPLRAKNTSNVFFFLVDFIHTFRMPVFFLIAGFFGAFLFFNKSPEQMLKNRFRRILLTVIVFLIILRPFSSFSFKYCVAIFDGEIPATFTEHFSSFENYIPYNLSHLWFLYYLFIISVLAYLFSKLPTHVFVSSIDSFFERTFKNPVYRLVTLTSVSFIILFLFDAKSFETSVSWLPDFGILTYFLVFYITGWLLYRKNELVSTLKHFDIEIIAVGVFAFCLKFYYENQMNLNSLQLINSIITCSLSIGIIGLFLRFADIPNNYITYFANSAYWVYIIHFFIAILLSALLSDVLISVYFKFLIVLLGTTTICLTTYHFFVRKTFIGVFLNGKKT
jgi:glucan biosynthesis protein C